MKGFIVSISSVRGLFLTCSKPNEKKTAGFPGNQSSTISDISVMPDIE